MVISGTLPLVVNHGHFVSTPSPSLTTSYMDDPLPPSMIFKKLFCWIVSLNRYCSVVKRTPDWGNFLKGMANTRNCVTKVTFFTSLHFAKS